MTRRSRGELKRLARECLLGKYPVVIAARLGAFFLPIAVLAPFSAGLTIELNIAFVTYLLAALIIQLLGQLLTVGVLRMHLHLAQGQPVAFLDLFWSFRNRPDRLILATALFYALLAVPAALAGAAVYFFAPEGKAGMIWIVACTFLFLVGEIFVLLTFGMIYPIYMEHEEMTVLEGFRAAKELMSGNKKRLLLLYISFIGWQLLGFFSIGIGFLWIRPYRTQTAVNFYLDLTGGLNRKGMHIDASVEGDL